MIEARATGAGFFVDADRFIGNIRQPSVSGRLTETALLRRAASAAYAAGRLCRPQAIKLMGSPRVYTRGERKARL